MYISKVNFNNGALQRPTTTDVKPVAFGIYKGTHKTYYGFVDNGVFKDKVIDIYHAFDDKGNLKHKLYYISNTLGKWVRSKLKFYKDGKCYYTAKGEAKR